MYSVVIHSLLSSNNGPYSTWNSVFQILVRIIYLRFILILKLYLRIF